MVRWYHAIVSAYGFWLPNDPRGSWSDFVRAWELFRFGGPATTVSDKHNYARDPHDAKFRRAMKSHLKYPAARFNETSRASVARGIELACSEFGFIIHAGAIGFDHVHLVTERNPSRSIEQVVAVLKARATRQMNVDDTNPMNGFRQSDGAIPTPWGKSCWSVFINDEIQLRAAIDYVARHPTKEGLAPQHWKFITPFPNPV